MIVRAARAADAPAIAEIWNHYIDGTAATFTTLRKSPEEIVRTIGLRHQEGRAFLVVEEAGRILGFATYSQFRGGPGYARTMEHTVILKSGETGSGRGRALMTALEDHARKAGMHSLLAGVSAENSGAVAFHERIGFVKVAVIPEAGRKFGRWMDLILLQKRLE